MGQLRTLMIFLQWAFSGPCTAASKGCKTWVEFGGINDSLILKCSNSSTTLKFISKAKLSPKRTWFISRKHTKVSRSNSFPTSPKAHANQTSQIMSSYILPALNDPPRQDSCSLSAFYTTLSCRTYPRAVMANMMDVELLVMFIIPSACLMPFLNILSFHFESYHAWCLFWIS